MRPEAVLQSVERRTRMRLARLRGTVVGLSILASGANAEIVDTIGGFDESSEGWSGRLAGSFSVSGGNTDKSSVTGSGRAQWQSTTERVRLILAGTQERADGERTDEEALGHLRHNHRLDTWLRTLAFVQMQHNPFQRLKSRTLFGAGLRVEPLTRERTTVAVGAAYMLELERLEGEAETTTAHRLASFVALNASPRDGVELRATAFVQPRVDAFDDVRLSLDVAASSRVVGGLSLVVAGSLTYDSEPPADVVEEDWTVESGLELSL